MYDFPRIRPVGLDGLLVSFADRLAEPANRAALAFRAAVDRAGWDGVEETATSLVSTYVRLDPLAEAKGIEAKLAELLADRDWRGEPLPEGRTLWRIPTVFGGQAGPQLAEAAARAGLEEAEAIRQLSTTRLRVQTIGFAPGQPYLGVLPEAWDIPRQEALTDKVPVGAVTVAIRQIVLFAAPSPTGWRQVGRTAFRAFRPEAEDPFLLRPGDEVEFTAAERLPDGPDGGAEREPIP